MGWRRTYSAPLPDTSSGNGGSPLPLHGQSTTEESAPLERDRCRQFQDPPVLRAESSSPAVDCSRSGETRTKSVDATISYFTNPEVTVAIRDPARPRL